MAITDLSTSDHLGFLLPNSAVRGNTLLPRYYNADIIDSIGERYRELILPIPKDPARRAAISSEAQQVAEQRAEMREILKRLPYWAEGITAQPEEAPPAANPLAPGNFGFQLRMDRVRNNIYIPRYYDPDIEQRIDELRGTHEMVALGDLVERGVLTFDIGIQVGKINYGTGPIPFVRTSDLVNWEVKVDPKHAVAEYVYLPRRKKLDVRMEDLFIVFDGTYLVGDSAIVTEEEPRIIYSNSIFKVRVLDRETLDPYLLLVLLNTPIVRRQIRAKQFTRDVIDTVGQRIYEVFIPIPKDDDRRRTVITMARQAVQTRSDLRTRVRLLGREIEDLGPPDKELDEVPEEELEV